VYLASARHRGKQRTFQDRTSENYFRRGIVQIEKFKQWLRSKRYSENTIYLQRLKNLPDFLSRKSVVEINNEGRDYL
jgi:hypothetical protein